MVIDVACGACQATNPVSAKFCMTCGSSLSRAAASGMRFVTVAFCDISGSTQLALRFDPQVWHSILEVYFDTVGEALMEAGGRLEKFIGDAVVGVFGADTAGEDDALRAVQGAMSALDRLNIRNEDSIERHGVRLSVRFGVASGRVVTTERNSSFATGSVMNRAARLQAAAPPDGTVVDVRTWLLVRDRFRCDPLAPVPAKGFDRPLQAWSVSRTSTRTGASTNLVNQVDLLGRLRAEVARAASASGVTTIALYGEMGSGKTRILDELVNELSADDIAVLRLDSDRSDEDQGTWRLQQIHRELVPTSARSVGAPSTHELQWGIRRRLTNLSHERPLLIVMDDYPSAPQAVRDLLRFPAGGTGPIVVVVAGRDVDDGCDVVLRVPLLDPRHARELLDTLVGDIELHSVSIATEPLVHRSQGNPLFLEQLAAMAIDGIDDELPPSAEAALGARIDRLSSAARHILACIGAWERAISPTDLVAICDLDEQSLGVGLDELEAAGLDDNKTAAAVAFHHLVLGDRAKVHSAIARRLQEHAAGEPALLDLAMTHALRGHECWRQLEPGGRNDKAATRLASQCLIAAGRHAISRSEYRLAVTRCAQARELAVMDDALTLEIASLESYALGAAGQPSEALDRIHAVAGLSGNPSAIAHLCVTEAVFTGKLGAQARELVEAAADPFAKARLELWEGVQHARAGDYPGAERSLRAAYLRVRTFATGLGISDIYASLPLFLAYGDTPIPHAREQCLELRRAVVDTPLLHAVVSGPTALLVHLGGDNAEARRMLEAARTVFVEMDDVLGEARTYEFTSEVAELAGDVSGARDATLRAQRLFQQVGAEAAAAVCTARAYVLEPKGAPPDIAAADLRGSWVARILAHQIAALTAPTSAQATAHFDGALAEIAAIRGAGASVVALTSCLRIARTLGDLALVERVQLLLEAPTGRRGVRGA